MSGAEEEKKRNLRETQFTSKQPWNEKTILFEDRDVTITRDEIVLKRYYMPFARPKHIPLQDIQEFEVFEASHQDSHLWGPSMKYIRDRVILWWPYSEHGWFKGFYMKLKLCNQRYVHPAFTCSNISVVEEILKTQRKKE